MLARSNLQTACLPAPDAAALKSTGFSGWDDFMSQPEPKALVVGLCPFGHRLPASAAAAGADGSGLPSASGTPPGASGAPLHPAGFALLIAAASGQLSPESAVHEAGKRLAALCRAAAATRLGTGVSEVRDHKSSVGYARGRWWGGGG